MNEPSGKKPNPWNDFEPVSTEKKKGPGSIIAVIVVWALLVGGGFVIGGVVGVFWEYRDRTHAGRRRGPDIERMLDDTDAKANRRFMIGGVIGALGVTVFLVRGKLGMDD